MNFRGITALVRNGWAIKDTEDGGIFEKNYVISDLNDAWMQI